MKNLKQKFKRTVYNIFKDDILKIVAHQTEMRLEIPYKRIDFIELRTNLSIETLSDQHYQAGIEKAKSELLKGAREFIIIEENSDSDPYYRNATKVMLRLFIGKKNLQ